MCRCDRVHDDTATSCTVGSIYLQRPGHPDPVGRDDLGRTLDRLAADGVALIDPAPRRGAEGPVAFLHPRSCHGVLVELIEASGGPSWSLLGYDEEPPLA